MVSPVQHARRMAVALRALIILMGRMVQEGSHETVWSNSSIQADFRNLVEWVFFRCRLVAVGLISHNAAVVARRRFGAHPVHVWVDGVPRREFQYFSTHQMRLPGGGSEMELFTEFAVQFSGGYRSWEEVISTERSNIDAQIFG